MSSGTSAWFAVVAVMVIAATILVCKSRLGLVVVATIGCTFISWVLWAKAWLPKNALATRASSRWNSFEAAVVQRHRGLGIYDTSFFVKSTNIWVWFYLDHDGARWRNVGLDNNASQRRVTVTKGGEEIGYYWYDSGVFSNALNCRTYTSPIGFVEGDIEANWSTRKFF